MTDPAPSTPTARAPSGEIVVAVDGSDGSRAALVWAGGAARALGAPLRVVQCWEYPTSVPFPFGQSAPPPPEQVDTGVREAAQAFVAEVLADGPRAEIDVRRGPPAVALLAVIGESTPRMLVVGSRGLGGFAGLLLGSISRYCLEHAPCPVVVVPSPERGEVRPGLDLVVVGIDGSDEARTALDWALGLSRDSGTSVAAVHAFEPAFAELPPDVIASLREEATTTLGSGWCRDLDDRADCLLVDGDPREVLDVVASERAANLIVVGPLGTGTLRKQLGPVAAHLSAHATTPVAVVRS